MTTYNIGAFGPQSSPEHGHIIPSLPQWARKLLDELADGPVRIKRCEARDLQRALFGSRGLRDVPRETGTRTFELPHGDTLRFDYEPTRTPEEMAQIRAEIAQLGGTWWADDGLRTARFVTVTLLPNAEAAGAAA
jgi:hypothetical protein